MSRIILTIFLLCGISPILSAQSEPESSVADTLQIDQVIMKGLENNFAIRIRKNEQVIAENNNTIGNAGLLPVLDLTGSYTERIEDNVTSFSSNTIPNIDNSGVVTTNINYGISASWTIFDGLTQYATLDRLSVSEDISRTEAQIQVEQSLSDLITIYYQIVGTQKAYNVLRNTVDISEERIRIAETRLDLGSGSEYDLLQARADLNADRAALTRASTTLKRAKLDLRRLTADSSAANFDVTGDIVLEEPLSLQSLLNDARRQNRDLSVNRLNRSRAKAELNELRGNWFPQIDVSGGYSYNRNEASVGFTEFSETSGFNYGVTARLNLFNGFNRNRETQNARITLKNEELRIEELQLEIDNQIRQIYTQYSDALSLIQLEQENLQYAERSLDIALERFRLGTINSVELREVQQTLLDAENRLISAQIEAKSAETELLRLSGRLLSRQEGGKAVTD